MVGRMPVILLVMDAANNNLVVNTYVYANGKFLPKYDSAQHSYNEKHTYITRYL